MNKVVYPGSFDPITKGHLDIIKRAASIFDEVVILILKNFDKKGFFDYEDRAALIELATSDYDNVKVDISSDLLVNYLKDHNIKTILKGLRNSNDFQYEYEMALVNNTLDPYIDTVFLLSDPKLSMVSSTRVRELLTYEANIDSFVPESILKEIFELYNKK